MQAKKFFLNSLKYILVSGASKGFNYLILLYFAISDFSDQYVTILLLLSFEQLLSLILPLNNSSIIYSKSITDYNAITNKLISSSILIIIIYLVVFIIFQNSFYNYFNVNDLIVFFSIFCSMIINSYVVFLTNYYKLIENHSRALHIQTFLFISFISIVVCVALIESKVVAFFLGKAIGLFVVLILMKISKFDVTKFAFQTLSLNEFKKIINLYSVSILGWISGLGFMNIAKIYESPENLIIIGYILNLWNIFLLISIGINAVYHPLIKKFILKKQLNKAKEIKTKAFFSYLAIAFLSFTLYIIIKKTNLLIEYPRANNVFSVFPYTLLLFVCSIFYYVIHPFYLTFEKFGVFNFLTILSYFIWIVVMVILSFFEFEDYIWFLILLYFFKSMLLYIYGEIKLIRIKI